MRYALFLLLLSGCATTGEQGMRIVWHKLEGGTTYFPQGTIGVIAAKKVGGYTRFIDGACHVWAPDPPITVKDGKRTFDYGQWGTLGHEVKHCFSGKFHD